MSTDSAATSAAASTDADVFKYVPFASFVHASFWHKLTELKLDVDRLDTKPRPICGFYSNAEAVQQPLHELDCTAFNSGGSGVSGADASKSCLLRSPGVLHNQNTMEAFKDFDKLALLRSEGERIWAGIASGDCVRDPSRLAPFVLLSFADLKKCHFYYWFAFPTVARPVASAVAATPAADHFSAAAIEQLAAVYFSIADERQRAFFVLHANDDGTLEHRQLDAVIRAGAADRPANFAAGTGSLYFCFSDPSCLPNAGWPARLFLLMLAVLCPKLRGQQIRLLAVRCRSNVSVSPSVLFTVRLTDEPLDELAVAGGGGDAASAVSFIGWERNEQAKMLPRVANMAASMDPERLAKTSVSLNLKLMKWRLMPTLDLDRIAGTRCLLMGAGTLGCAVARNLLAWGVKHVTFVDNGKVSYSNPVRQSLFVFDDALKANDKAPTAAMRLAQICPGLQTAGHSMHIPMPGHPVSSAAHAQATTSTDIGRLEQLVRDHDAIFLLTDSRESRWLPAMLAAANGKIAVTAALGFDTYLVMRHGSRGDGGHGGGDEAVAVGPTASGWKRIGGDSLGCYFCNDITAPGNSLKDRTLDQQCTVTRPGVANIAGALAVELLVALLQHEHGVRAPAYASCRTADERTDRAPMPEGLLGIVPHSIRGMLSSFEHILPATERYSECIACSQTVLSEYRSRGNAFLFDVFNSAKYLEELTGINEAFHVRDDDELLELNDSESD